ncbi:MAG: Hint domain-containing protein [Azonexus sp.]|jgi:hypothetical protein|uniref:Hint domain-containing protein n=1 Tax=Azonexus sp. TaxID=1872668 RepID=UPI0028385C8D|nr:Hint domain-containing protein [Azonexus sp.]MDR0775666.1 Hint domain-containing protein [Azonexus sp.]
MGDVKKQVGKTKAEIDVVGCFIAGTLVHTKEGLVPIEQIKVGDWVLTKPENGEGERTYKRVTQTFRYEDREIWRLEIYSAKECAAAQAEKRAMHDSDRSYLIATPNHPIWINDRKGWRDLMGRGVIPSDYNPGWIKEKGWASLKDWVESKGWTSLQHLKSGDELEFANGELAVVTDVFPLNRTYDEGVALHAFSLEWDGGVSIDLRNGQSGEFDGGTKPPISEDYWGESEDRPDFYRTTVYNLEVEDCHNYYAGTRGIWVHNTSAVGWVERSETHHHSFQ